MAALRDRSFLDASVLSKLSGWPLCPRMPMLGSVSGRHRSPIRGSSLEFAEYRKYSPGDDLRRLDWRAWGRSDRYFIKEFEADTNLRLCLVVDTSGSMNYTAEEGMTKLDFARRLAGTLAYLAASQGDAVALYCAGEHFKKEIPAKRSAAHLGLVLDSIGEMSAEGETGLPEALHEAAEKVPQRALFVILSDLFMQPAVLKDAFAHLRFRKHDVAVFQILGEAEIDFEFNRPTRFIDLEGGAPVLADPSVIASSYRKAVAAYFADLEAVVRGAGVDYHRVKIEEEYGDVLSRFLLRRTPKKGR
ncbi:MAG: DUF58 domain-containing protein [Verrucomicrobiota bacterium]